MVETQRVNGRDTFNACARLAQDQPAFVARLMRGDQGAADCLDAAYRSRLSRVVRTYLRNEEDVAEAVQDTFLQALRGLPRFRGDSGLSTWLHRIAVNRALMTLRRRRRRPEASLTDAREGAADLVWSGLSSEARAIDAQAREHLHAAIEALPPSYREIVGLVHGEGLSIAESAERLRVSRNAVKIRALRARRALKLALGPQFATR